MLFGNFAKKGMKGLKMKVRNQLKTNGYDADVFAVIIDDDAQQNPGEISPIDPNATEDDWDDDPIADRVINPNPNYHHATTKRATIRVGFSTHIDGLDIGPTGVSTSDKLRTEYKMVTLDPLEEREKLTVHIPDDVPARTRDFLVIKALAQNDFSQVGYAYTVRVL